MQSIGEAVIQLILSAGRFILFFFAIIFQGLRPPFYIKQWARLVLSIGYGSLFLIALTALFTGMVLALQVYYSFSKLNLTQMLPEIISVAVLKELGPVLTGLMMAGRLGASIAAEIGTMRVTEQIDALITLSTNPIRYLVMPRFMASLFILPFLTMISDVIGILGGYIIGVFHFQLPYKQYLSQTYQSISFADGSAGLIKALVFGLIIGLVGCYQGYYTKQGAVGVGQSTTNGVVYSSIFILAANYFLTELLFH